TSPICVLGTKCTLPQSKPITTKSCIRIIQLSVRLELLVLPLQILKKKRQPKKELRLQPKAVLRKLPRHLPKHNPFFLKISEKHPVNSGCFFYFYRRIKTRCRFSEIYFPHSPVKKLQKKIP